MPTVSHRPESIARSVEIQTAPLPTQITCFHGLLTTTLFKTLEEKI
jgi:hypothetical protein